jgi:hypothetical protein
LPLSPAGIEPAATIGAAAFESARRLRLDDDSHIRPVARAKHSSAAAHGRTFPPSIRAM